MVYRFRYRQTSQDDLRYLRVYKVLDECCYLHELSRGELLVAPICHVHHLREQLGAVVARSDTMLLSTILVNSFEDPAARSFVDAWIDAGYEKKEMTLCDLAEVVGWPVTPPRPEDAPAARPASVRKPSRLPPVPAPMTARPACKP